MARSDLLIALAQAGTEGDKTKVRAVVEAIIAEERAKQHNILADRLTNAIQIYREGSSSYSTLTDSTRQSRDLILEIAPRRRLGDLVLPESIHYAVLEFAEEQHRADLLRAYGLEPRHRILLVGPPGTGKTSLAEAIAEVLAVPLFVVRYETIIGSYLGETASRLSRVIDYAKTTPCVLFFDEFDTIAKERGDVHETGEIKRVVSSLLMQMDSVPSYTVIIAATNHAELLDRASWRRFQLRLSLPMPNKETIAIYIERFAEKFEERLDYCSREIAERLGPINFSDVEQFCLNVQRKHILAMDVQLNTIVAQQLRLWSERAKPNRAILS